MFRKRISRVLYRNLEKCMKKELCQYRLLWTFCLIFTTLLIYFHLSYVSRTNKVKDDNLGKHSKEECECDEGWRSHFIANEEEKRIFQSIRMEHIHLLEKLTETSDNLEAMNKLVHIREAALRELELKIEQLKLLQKDYSDRRNVQLRLPHRPMFLSPLRVQEFVDAHQKQSFKYLEDSIDFSRCSITAQFRVFLYPIEEKAFELAQNFYNELSRQGMYITNDPGKSCIFVAIIGPNDKFDARGLAHFGANGRNHLLIDFSAKLQPHMVGAAMIVSSGIGHINRRPSMDIPSHLFAPDYNPNGWQHLPQLLPATRKYLIGFVAIQGQLSHSQGEDMAGLKESLDASQDPHFIEILDCSAKSNNSQCSPGKEERLNVGRKSTFSLIFPNLSNFQERFYESLAVGSVPVICSLHQPLPFDEFIDWRLAVVRLAPSRFPELHFILRSISKNDLIELKRRGRFFFENYLADSRVLSRTILSALRHRLQSTGAEEPEPEALPLYKGKWDYPSFLSTATKPPYDDEYLGPNEAPMDSAGYTHNYTSFSLYSSALWNEFPFATAHSPRFLPLDHPLPSDAEFDEDSSFGMRPIQPGSGAQFAQALGGNRPREQFTIVIVSFNREQVLANTLERLIGLPFLSRVIVVWNDVDRPPSLAAWPRLNVPLLFVNGTRNSLNNRFVPYKEIATEAVLSMDDDIELKQYEIVFAFRVWREHRDRIAGFPARYHARFGDDNFYNSNHTCQFSMVLTGAAFIHKFFFHAYTSQMPAIIREKVDEWMNCEDLAMNFLVSHLTRKPPVKTTSKWTLRCPTCAETLSNDLEHFKERHECIRFFTRVYGYNPLLFSQVRLDSVLFKTRVPASHQKCFRYV